MKGMVIDKKYIIGFAVAVVLIVLTMVIYSFIGKENFDGAVKPVQPVEPIQPVNPVNPVSPQ